MENKYKPTDCGGLGKTVEVEIKTILGLTQKVARAGRTDLRKGNICYEVKTGAGELGLVDGKLVKGSSMVIYIPVVNENVNLLHQEGFVMSRELFLSTLEEIGMTREKTTTNGQRKITIQTFYNRKLNKPHGKGYQKILDAFYNLEGNGVELLEDWIIRQL